MEPIFKTTPYDTAGLAAAAGTKSPADSSNVNGHRENVPVTPETDRTSDVFPSERLPHPFPDIREPRCFAPRFSCAQNGSMYGNKSGKLRPQSPEPAAPHKTSRQIQE